jgi:hypothetical protein
MGQSWHSRDKKSALGGQDRSVWPGRLDRSALRGEPRDDNLVQERWGKKSWDRIPGIGQPAQYADTGQTNRMLG